MSAQEQRKMKSEPESSAGTNEETKGLPNLLNDLWLAGAKQFGFTEIKQTLCRILMIAREHGGTPAFSNPLNQRAARWRRYGRNAPGGGTGAYAGRKQ